MLLSNVKKYFKIYLKTPISGEAATFAFPDCICMSSNYCKCIHKSNSCGYLDVQSDRNICGNITLNLLK